MSAVDVRVAISGSYDHGRRRQAVRKGRERGCWVYIAGEELERVGRLDADPPKYRTWGTSRGGVFVRLYKTDEPKGAA